MGIISNKSHYALKAVLELCKSQNLRPISISDIAFRQEIPARFLEAILRELKQGGIVSSVRGKDGGYLLAKDPAQISVAAVLGIFSKNFVSQDDVVEEGSVFSELVKSADDVLTSFFSSVNFKTICEMDRKVNFVPEYSI